MSDVVAILACSTPILVVRYSRYGYALVGSYPSAGQPVKSVERYTNRADLTAVQFFSEGSIDRVTFGRSKRGFKSRPSLLWRRWSSLVGREPGTLLLLAFTFLDLGSSVRFTSAGRGFKSLLWLPSTTNPLQVGHLAQSLG